MNMQKAHGLRPCAFIVYCLSGAGSVSCNKDLLALHHIHA